MEGRQKQRLDEIGPGKGLFFIRDRVEEHGELVSGEAREALNVEWIKCFPDEHDRPARHTLVKTDLPGGMLMQIEIIAVIQS